MVVKEYLDIQNDIKDAIYEDFVKNLDKFHITQIKYSVHPVISTAIYVTVISNLVIFVLRKENLSIN